MYCPTPSGLQLLLTQQTRTQVPHIQRSVYKDLISVQASWNKIIEFYDRLLLDVAHHATAILARELIRLSAKSPPIGRYIFIRMQLESTTTTTKPIYYLNENNLIKKTLFLDASERPRASCFTPYSAEGAKQTACERSYGFIHWCRPKVSENDLCVCVFGGWYSFWTFENIFNDYSQPSIQTLVIR